MEERRRRRSLLRLPADSLNMVTPEHVWNSVQRLLTGKAEHEFGDSMDYELIADGGARLAPKAVFGLAATEALGFEVTPKHFTSGLNSACFRILQSSGFQIARKNATLRKIPIAKPNVDEDSDIEYREGTPQFRRHLRRERALGLRQAKISSFRRHNDGRLFCERCKFDPLDHYNNVDADACIEVHHRVIQIHQMKAGHTTRLDDLQCLCANCHRVIHRELKRTQSLEVPI